MTHDASELTIQLGSSVYSKARQDRAVSHHPEIRAGVIVRLPSRLLPTFATLVACLSSGFAEAQEQVKSLQPVGIVTSIERVHLGDVSPQVMCRLGEIGPPAFIFDYFYSAADEYLTQINPPDCTSCPSITGLRLTTAHVIINFQSACSMPITVAVVGASETLPAGCFLPDRHRFLCEPTNYTLAPGAVGTFDFELALSADCCINERAFLLFRINTFGTCPDNETLRPRLVTTASCVPCRSWNLHPINHQHEFCAFGFPGNATMYVDSDCCQTTPTRSDSWGRIKTFYR